MKLQDGRLHNQLTPAAAEFAGLLTAVLKEANYDHINSRLRGGSDYSRYPLPSLSYDLLRYDFEKDFLKDKFLDPKEHLLAKLFMLNMPVSQESAERELGAAIVTAGLEAGVFRLENQALRTDNLCLSSLRISGDKVIYFFSDAPSHYLDKQANNNVYCNHDSYMFRSFLSASPQAMRARSCLEFGSGSALQLISLSAQNQQLSQAFGLEINERARRISRLNIDINGMSDRISIISDPSVIRMSRFDLVISNPPFLPCPRMVDAAGQVFDLKEKFPVAGYGGIYGLDTTDYFLELTEAHLHNAGTAFFFGQYAKSRSGLFFVEQLATKHNLAMTLKPFYEDRESSSVSERDMSTNIATVLLQDGHCKQEQAKEIRAAISAVFIEHGVEEALTGMLVCEKGKGSFTFVEQEACFSSSQSLFPDESGPEHLSLS